MSDKKASLSIEGLDGPVELPVYSGTIGPDVVDVGGLTAQGMFTYDPGFVSTASCESQITYIDGGKGILRYRGYPIEQLAELLHERERAARVRRRRAGFPRRLRGIAIAERGGDRGPGTVLRRGLPRGRSTVRYGLVQCVALAGGRQTACPRRAHRGARRRRLQSLDANPVLGRAVGDSRGRDNTRRAAGCRLRNAP